MAASSDYITRTAATIKRWTIIILCTLVLAVQAASSQADSFAICSFNIQFLGQPTTRDTAAIAAITGLRDKVCTAPSIVPTSGLWTITAAPTGSI